MEGKAMKQHRADAYCHVCGGRCTDPDAIMRAPAKPLSLGPLFTEAGRMTFNPARKPDLFER